MKQINPAFSFFTTLIVTFVLLVHNGTEPVFLVAYALIPVLIFFFHRKPTPWYLILYLVVFGAIGRYTRYYRETYASDALLAIRDYVGYFLAGKHPYKEMIMAQSGLTPFTYLPFSLFWYAPVQVLGIDLRFFEMLISSLVPVVFVGIGMLTNLWAMLPVLSVVSLTPFLMDLSSDGSNDNSAVFLLLLSVLCLFIALRKKKSVWGIASAVMLGFAASFKHYVVFYLMYLVPFVLQQHTMGGIRSKKYLMILAGVIAVLFLPFALTEPTGFWRSLHFIEIGNWHSTWGWNVWVALRDALGWETTKQTMWTVRTIGTGLTILASFLTFKRFSLRTVLVATGATMLVYLALSNWTSYAYFTFLVPIMGLAAVLR